MKPLELATETRVRVESELDIVTARMRGRALAIQLGLRPTSATLIATAISELARNILLYAQDGEIVLCPIERGAHKGLAVIARDDGPGIRDVTRAIEDGYSTSGRLGMGLPGVRRLMDEFHIQSRVGEGTTVTVKKWKE